MLDANFPLTNKVSQTYGSTDNIYHQFRFWMVNILLRKFDTRQKKEMKDMTDLRKNKKNVKKVYVNRELHYLLRARPTDRDITCPKL